MSEHRENERGYCWKEGEPWPCLTQQLTTAQARAALWKRAAKRARGDWNAAMGYWHASAEAYGAAQGELSTANARIVALEAALRWYADEEHYYESGAAFSRPRYDEVHEDKGQRARAVLAAAATPPAAAAEPSRDMSEEE